MLVKSSAVVAQVVCSLSPLRLASGEISPAPMVIARRQWNSLPPILQTRMENCTASLGLKRFSNFGSGGLHCMSNFQESGQSLTFQPCSKQRRWITGWGLTAGCASVCSFAALSLCAYIGMCMSMSRQYYSPPLLQYQRQKCSIRTINDHVL